MGEVFCLYTGRGISVGWCCISAIYGSSTYTVRYMAWYRIAPVIAGKERIRRYIGKMVFSLGNTRNCAYRAKYAVIEGLYMVTGIIGIYGGSSF